MTNIIFVPSLVREVVGTQTLYYLIPIMKNIFYLHRYVNSVEDSTIAKPGFSDLLIIQGQHHFHQKDSTNYLTVPLFEINEFIGTLEYKNSWKPENVTNQIRAPAGNLGRGWGGERPHVFLKDQ